MKHVRLILVLGLLAVCRLPAQTGNPTADQLIQEGRAFLQQKDLVQANARFLGAVQAAPKNTEANALAAATRVLVLAQHPVVFDVMNRLGISGQGRTIYKWTADFTKDADHRLIIPNKISSDEFLAFANTHLLPAVQGALLNLSVVTSPTFKLQLSAAETSFQTIVVDYGDVLLLRAMLNSLQFFVHTLNSHNVSVWVDEILGLHDPDESIFPRLLEHYPLLLTSGDKASLELSRTDLTRAIASYQDASTFVRKRPLTQNNHLFNLVPDRPIHDPQFQNEYQDRLKDEAKFRDILSKISQSITRATRFSNSDPTSLYLAPYFAGNQSVRSVLPKFRGTNYVIGSLDATFGGVLGNANRQNLEQDLIKKFGGVPGGEIVRPAVKITYPTSDQTVAVPNVVLLGTASDNVGVAAVKCKVRSEPYATANGTSPWSAPVSLLPGTNVIWVIAVDVNGNESSPVRRVLVYIPSAPITLAVDGHGKITGATNGQWFPIGKLLKLTASNATDSLFLSWSGSVVTNSQVIQVVMQSNLNLTASFKLNPAVPAQGIYNGLFMPANNNDIPTIAGAFTITLTARGSYSGKVFLRGQSAPFSGQFDANGASSCSIGPKSKPTLTMKFQLNPSNTTEMLGSAVDGVWTASLRGDRQMFNSKTNPAPQAGVYTLVIPGATDSQVAPGGAGYGTVTVTALGSVQFKGTLADGFQTTQGAMMSSAGVWPFFASWLQGQELLIGWLNFTNGNNVDILGKLTWVKMPRSIDRIYPNGFILESAGVGSRYATPAKGKRALGATNWVATIEGGALAIPMTNSLVLTTNNRFTVTGGASNRLTLNLVSQSGLFNGSFTPPGTTKPWTFNGAVLQKFNSNSGYGSGYFLVTNRSGLIQLQPAP
jgi:hypothetical protein